MISTVYSIYSYSGILEANRTRPKSSQKKYKGKESLISASLEMQVHFLKSAMQATLAPIPGVCKPRTGYLRMADADGKMRVGKRGWKNADSQKK